MNRLMRGVLATLIPLLAVIAGIIHVAHNYLPQGGPPSGASGGPPVGGGPPAGGVPGGPGGLQSLIGPHLTQVFVLNFVAYMALAVLFVIALRLGRGAQRAVGLLLILLSLATLYAWNDFGRSNPDGLGTMALMVEGVLIVLAAVHALIRPEWATRRHVSTALADI